MGDNHGMQKICKKVGFNLVREPDSPDFRAEYVFKS
jgi:hypothetical protein